MSLSSYSSSWVQCQKCSLSSKYCHEWSISWQFCYHFSILLKSKNWKTFNLKKEWIICFLYFRSVFSISGESFKNAVLGLTWKPLVCFSYAGRGLLDNTGPMIRKTFLKTLIVHWLKRFLDSRISNCPEDVTRGAMHSRKELQ